MTADSRSKYTKAIQTIEYHLLAPDITESDTVEGCKQAMLYHIPVVCVRPCYVHQSNTALRGSTTTTATVIGYPFGDTTKKIKVAEAKLALTEGVSELNMVANAVYLLDGKDESFIRDIESICCLARMNGALVNIILNCEFLSDYLVEKGSQYIANVGADWISPSTGLGKCNDEKYMPLIRKAVKGKNKLKTMGSIESFSTWKRRYDLGCRRFGTRELNTLLNSFELIEEEH